MTDSLNRTDGFTATGRESAEMQSDMRQDANSEAAYGTRDDQIISTADLAGGGEDTTQLARTRPQTATAREEMADDTPLFPASEASSLRTKWDTVQAGFVDEPRRAVEDADALVAGAMKRLAETFAAEREKLEGQWDRDGEASTEDLRLALKRYRTFFGRLLAI